MTIIFTIKDKTGRIIRLTEERWQHLAKHPHVQHNLDEIKNALMDPQKITDYSWDENVKFYYKYDKHRDAKAKYLPGHSKVFKR